MRNSYAWELGQFDASQRTAVDVLSAVSAAHLVACGPVFIIIRAYDFRAGEAQLEQIGEIDSAGGARILCVPVIRISASS